MMWIITLL